MVRKEKHIAWFTFSGSEKRPQALVDLFIYLLFCIVVSFIGSVVSLETSLPHGKYTG